MKSEKRVKFWKALLFAVTFATLALSVSVGCVAATTHYVNPCESIQLTVDAANPGDTIIVKDGIYTENVDVNKRLMIQSENGSENCIVQAASSYDHVFDVMAGYVNINGFTVIGAMGMWKAGIYLTSGADYCAISNNNASNNDCGIYFDYSNNNTLNNNIASNNDWGIHLGYSSNNTIISNTVNSNDYGILLGSSPKNKLSDNAISNNKIINLLVDGVDIDDYKNDIDTSNKVNGKSVYYYFGENHLVLNHLDTNHITTANCSNITIENNNITDGDPITLVFTTESIVKNNTINHRGCPAIAFGAKNFASFWI